MKLNRLLISSIFVYGAILQHACFSGDQYSAKLPDHFAREGLVSSNSYQVHVQVLASSASEAERTGRPQAQAKTLRMILREPSLNSRLGYNGKKAIESLVKTHGQVVYVQPVDTRHWQVVYQVYKTGLWDYLRRLY